MTAERGRRSAGVATGALTRMGLAALALSAALVACGGVTFVNTNPAPRPLSPRTAATVEVYTTDTPDEPYTEIGIMEASEGMFDSMEDMIDDMREVGAEHGCEGIILTERSEEVSTSSDGSVDTRTIYSATCFVYDEPAGESVTPWHIQLSRR